MLRPGVAERPTWRRATARGVLLAAAFLAAPAVAAAATEPNGTFVYESGNPTLYEVIGQSLVGVSKCDDFPGSAPGSCLNPILIANPQDYQPVPVDGSLVRIGDGQSVGGIYEAIGGAFVHVDSCDAFGGTCAGDLTIDSGGFALYTQAHPIPAGGEFVIAAGTVVSGGPADGWVGRMVGGSLVHVDSCSAYPGGACTPEAVLDDGGVRDYIAAHPQPANSAFVQQADGPGKGNYAIVAGGAFLPVTDCVALGGCAGAVALDSASYGDFIRAHPNPANGTLLEGIPSGTTWAYVDGKRRPAAASAFAVQINDATLDSYPVDQASAAPTITGTDQQGEILTVHNGTYDLEPPVSYAYDWERCDAGGANCTAIGSPPVATYTLTAADVGSTIRAIETASDKWGPTTPATTGQTPVVATALPLPTRPPMISGTAIVGQTLTETHGSWSNAPTTYALQWLRCGPSGTGCVTVIGATDATYVVQVPDAGSTLAVQETASNSFGPGATATSGATGPVEFSPPTVTTLAATSVTQGTAVLDASVNPNGGPVAATFVYGTSATLAGAGRTSPQVVPSGLGAVAVSATLTGLHSSQTYYFQVKATNTSSGASVLGAVRSFTTPAPLRDMNDVTMSGRFVRYASYVTVASLVVHKAPLGAVVHVACQGKRCPKAKSVRVKAKAKARRKGKHRAKKPPTSAGVNLTSIFARRHLARGSKLTIEIVKPGWIGKVFIYKLAGDFQPVIACLAPGGSKPGKNC